MVGMLMFLMLLAVAALTAVFIGLTLALLVVAVVGFIFLWLYGSFWTTLLMIFLGGLSYSFSHERLALLITTIYFVYCAWIYTGWLGLLLALNLSFISSDVLIHYLKKNIDQQARPNVNPEQTNGMHGQPAFFNEEAMHASFCENAPYDDELRREELLNYFRRFQNASQKVDPPSAYVCADSKIFNATEWYICQVE